MSLAAGYTLPAKLPTVRLREALVHRIATLAKARKEPAFRAAGTNRFDDAAQGFKTLYCAAAFGTCFSETLLRGGGLLVSKADYDMKAAVLLLLATSVATLPAIFTVTVPDGAVTLKV